MTQKTAIVTGAGTGIGKAIVRQLVADGFAIGLIGRRETVLEATAGEIDPTGTKTQLLVGDIGDAQTVNRLFEQFAARWKRLDLLVNNAGISAPGVALEDVSPDAWRAVVAVNLDGAFFCTQAGFRIMKAQSPRGGRIINNGSISATTPRPQSAPYAATKHAITGLTKAAALDGRPFDIAVGQIDIGNASTDMTSTMSQGVLQADGSTATEPTMDVDHVAKAVSYMAGLPLDANVLTMTVMATGMPFVGRG